MSEKIVLVSVDENTYFEKLPLSLFSEFEGGAPAVGKMFYIKTMPMKDGSCCMDYGPTLEIREVVHGVFRDIIPPEVSEVFTNVHNQEGYWVKAVTIDV